VRTAQQAQVSDRVAAAERARPHVIDLEKAPGKAPRARRSDVCAPRAEPAPLCLMLP